MNPDNDWWRGAVFYQVYPRSFMDSNANGIGDLPGITEKLGHIADLGVDAIWLSPFFKSPMKDFGYDVSDYRDVDPLFGTLSDFDDFLKKTHTLGLKVIIDIIMSHTSEQHPWFVESRKDKTNPKADWYVWVDPKENGSIPNNWVSVFGGPAWEWDETRGQYYMHNWLKEQPDLNYHNPDIQDAMLDECRFWLERGVDGFRLDVINFTFHDQKLRDNPPKNPEKDGYSSQFTKPDPYNDQHHIYDKSRPEALEFAKRFRKMMNEYPGTMTVAEIGDDDFVARAAEYTSDNDKFNTAYNFSLMTGEEITVSKVIDAIEAQRSQPGDSWPSWTFCNHDVIRVVTRWGKKQGYDNNPAFAKMLTALLLSLRGTIFMYQGEELGLTEAQIPFEKIQDPWGKHTWPEWQGRDGCRTPMPWEAGKPNTGFSAAEETWLPTPEEHKIKAVDVQEKDKNSVLHFTRTFLKWRKGMDDLLSGDIEFLNSGNESLLAFTRGKTLCIFNLSDKNLSFESAPACDPCKDHPQTEAVSVTGQTINLPGFSVFFAELKN